MLEAHVFAVRMHHGRHSFELLELPWKASLVHYDFRSRAPMREVGNPSSGFLDEAGVFAVEELIALAPEGEREALRTRLRGALFCLTHVFES